MLSIYSESSVIERFNEGDFVMNSMLSNIPISKIVRDLNTKHNTNLFTNDDLKYFLQRNPEVSQKLILKSNEFMDHQIKTHLNHELALTKLYNENQEMLKLVKNNKEFNPQLDTDNVIKLTKNMHDIVISDAKLRGRFKEGTEVNINVQAKELVNQIVTNPTDFQKELMTALHKKEPTIIDVHGSSTDPQN
jgi:hypothetical protein